MELLPPDRKEILVYRNGVFCCMYYKWRWYTWYWSYLKNIESDNELFITYITSHLFFDEIRVRDNFIKYVKEN